MVTSPNVDAAVESARHCVRRFSRTRRPASSHCSRDRSRRAFRKGVPQDSTLNCRGEGGGLYESGRRSLRYPSAGRNARNRAIPPRQARIRTERSKRQRLRSQQRSMRNRVLGGNRIDGACECSRGACTLNYRTPAAAVNSEHDISSVSVRIVQIGGRTSSDQSTERTASGSVGGKSQRIPGGCRAGSRTLRVWG